MISRRRFIQLFIAGTTAMSASALSGCANPDNTSWAATYDESLGLLVAGPNEDAIMGNAWILRDDGAIQLQFAAGSIPVPAIESSCMRNNDLRVFMASSNSPATMDLRLHQFALTPPQGINANAVESVTLIVNGKEYPAERADGSIIQTNP